MAGVFPVHIAVVIRDALVLISNIVPNGLIRWSRLLIRSILLTVVLFATVPSDHVFQRIDRLYVTVDDSFGVGRRFLLFLDWLLACQDKCDS